MKDIIDYFNELFPNPKCELNYSKDYELLIAVMLSAQTTDKRVNQVTKVLFDKYKTLEELCNADISDIKLIIRSIGSYNKKSEYVKQIAYILLNEYNGQVPTTNIELEKIPGVGRKTANVVISELYSIPAIAVDTHVERVSKRLGLAEPNDDVRKVEMKLQSMISQSLWIRMHHQMVLFGRYYCKAVKPNCETCKLKSICIKGK